MEISTHMVKLFDPKSVCGRVLRAIEELFSPERKIGLRLEWSPPRIIPKHNGYTIHKIRGDGWKLFLSVKGEPRHVARISGVDDADIARIKNLVKTMVGKKPKEKAMPTATEPAANIGTEVAPNEQTGGTKKGSIGPDLILLAIEEIISGEKIELEDGYYPIEGFNKKVLAIVTPNVNDPTSRQALRRAIQKLAAAGRLEILRNGVERRVRVKLSAESLQRMKPAVVAEKPAEQPVTTTPVSSPVAMTQTIAQALATLKESSWQEVLQIKEAIKSDTTLSSLIQFLLQK